ncbi:MAG: IS4 family transposase, partial [Pseudomonadota bacterium]
RLKLETELYTILQILSLTLFEKMSLNQLLMNPDYKNEECAMDNQLNLFNLTLGQ